MLTHASATSTSPGPAPRTFAAANYWALCVGIGVYAENPEQDRPLMISEVADFAQTLLNSGWLPDHVKVIKAEEATAHNILAGFRWLRTHEGSNDVSLVFLSTHGSPMGGPQGNPLDLPPKDEADGADEMLITYWGFAMPMTFLWDDEINVELNRLQSEGVCLIVDSCFAGGFNDHWTSTGASFSQTAAQWMTGFADDVKGQNRVVLMGCREDEEAMSGGFAPWLIDGLRGYADVNHDGVVTAEEAFNYTEPRAHGQQPTMYDGYPGELALVNVPASSPVERAVQLHPAGQTAGLNTLDSAMVRGYVTDANSSLPISDAMVNISGHTQGYEFYGNETTTNVDGYYEVGAPAGRYQLTTSAVGYCDRTTNSFNLNDSQIRWMNTSLYPRPEENATICGYILDETTSAPVIGADVTLSWHGGSGQSYHNATVSDGLGFYSMNVAAGRMDLSIEKAGYFAALLRNIIVGSHETHWENVSLAPHPAETAVICGYVCDADTGVPLAFVNLVYYWIDFAGGISYENGTSTDGTGFYTISVAAGELYRDIWVNGYETYDPYRHDGVANATSWQNISLARQKPSFDFLQPLNALYRGNHRIIPWSRPVVFGATNVSVYFEDMWYGGGDVAKVEFYLDGTLQSTVTHEPYTWAWSVRSLGKHHVKVIAYNFEGDTTSREISVLKLL